MIDWGVPDWRDLGAYSKHKWPSKWRWDFLRRLPAYRKDWIDRNNSRQVLHGEYLDALVAEGKYQPPGSHNTWRDLMSEQGWSPDGRHTDRWGLLHLENPSRKEIDSTLFVRQPESIRFFWPGKENAKDIPLMDWSRYKKTEVLIAFDLSQSIAEQVRARKELLKNLQHDYAKSPGNRNVAPGELIRHLRVIDAKDQGASNREIGETISKRKYIGIVATEEAKRWYRTAKGVQLRITSNL